MIRIAISTVKEINEIICLSKIIFNRSLKNYRPLFIQYHYWKRMIESNFAEIYLIYIDEKCVGFYFLIIDLDRFNLEKKKNLILNFLIRSTFDISTLIFNPKLSIELLPNLCIIESFSKRIVIDSPIFTRSRNEEMAWGELKGILPEYRKLGLGNFLNCFVIERCRKLNKKILGETIDKNNLIAEKLLISLGFIKSEQHHLKSIYKKVL